MSADCHNGSAHCFIGQSPVFRRALWAVIAINAIMFIVELSAGFAAGSQALKADALDFLGDSLTYGLSLAVLGMSLKWRARAALAKGISLALMAMWVLGATIYQIFVLNAPEVRIMGAVAFLALGANLASVLLLMRFRDGDANVRSVWLCSRNDAIGNVAVMLAASGVWATSTAWPDLIVAAGMAGLFLYSSIAIIRQATGELRRARQVSAPPHGHASHMPAE